MAQSVRETFTRESVWTGPDAQRKLTSGGSGIGTVLIAGGFTAAVVAVVFIATSETGTVASHRTKMENNTV